MSSALRKTDYLKNENQVGFSLHKKGIEYHTIAGGGVQLVELDAGDKIVMRDPEGMQYGEILVWDEQGRPNIKLLGESKGTDASATKIIFKMNENSSSFKFVQAGLLRRKINLNDSEAIGVFGKSSPMDSVVEFTATAKCFCLFSAPNIGYPTYGELPATDLDLFIHRVNVGDGNNVEVLPDPLGEVVDEFRIKAGTVADYQVKKGQYIQMIDVSGRQCSDWQAFDAKLLDKGIESMISATATRTHMGNMCPHPGLMSRYYSDDNERMAQIIVDTVGRHDTISNACTAKYYDDLGFPGHTNCSDNMSKAGKKYGIRERQGWEAVNFFFNTTGCNYAGISADETWSRPGDYTLIQASRDIVCLSSSCPDDLDPANGWNPTDIHIRIYDEKEMFKSAIGYRAVTDGKMRFTQETGFHARTSELTEVYEELAGYWIPQEYHNSSPREEYMNVRENVGVMDLSSLPKCEIFGPDAAELCQKVFTRNMDKLAINGIAYTAICYEHGGMVDDGTLFRFEENKFRFTGGCPTASIYIRNKVRELGLDVTVKDASPTINNISVQGPNSRKLLNKIIWTAEEDKPMEDLSCFQFTPARLNDSNGTPLLVSRTGYTGELGFEVWVAPKDAVELWDTVFEAGAEFGVKPFGLGALDMLRIEAGLIFAGLEFDDTTDPFEAGIGFAVPLKSQEADFIGRSAIERRSAHPHRVLVGLELEGNEPAQTGDCVRIGRAQIGEVTSAMISPILDKNIALARIDAMYEEIGTKMEVGKLDGFQKRIKAEVIEKPFYDPSRSRMRQHKDDD
ncbi:MAG: DUF1989 domain-containing protein [Alphaproteobacteria bacterium]